MYDKEDQGLIEEKIKSEKIFDGTLLHVRRATVRLPNGNSSVREWVAHPGAAAVLPLFADGSVLLVKQYRYPLGAITLEIPAGKLDAPDEDPLDCAKRELSEETGYSAKSYEKLTTLATTVGFSNEKIHIYMAKDLEAGKQHTDADEFINVVKMPLSEAVALVENGEIIDAKSMVALLMANSRR